MRTFSFKIPFITVSIEKVMTSFLSDLLALLDMFIRK